MSSEVNIKIIQGVYEAFGHGDVAAVLDVVADDVDWATEAAGSGAPWYGVRHNKGEIAKFFEEFGTAMEVEEWTPLAFAASDADVHAVGRIRTRSRATGKTVAMNLHHFFTLRDGKIVYWRGSEDTAQTQAALRG